MLYDDISRINFYIIVYIDNINKLNNFIVCRLRDNIIYI